MSRDSIIDEAAEQTEESPDDDVPDDEDGGAESRTRITQRVPDDLLEDIEAVQEAHHLPSRNAAVNFILSRGADDLLEDRGD